MKVQAPRGCRAVSIGGAEIALDETGAVEVPDHVGHDLVTYHRFKKAAAAGGVSSSAKGKADKESPKQGAK